MKHLSEPNETDKELNRIMLWATILGWSMEGEHYKIRLMVDDSLLGDPPLCSICLSKNEMEKQGMLDFDGSVLIGQTLKDIEDVLI